MDTTRYTVEYADGRSAKAVFTAEDAALNSVLKIIRREGLTYAGGSREADRTLTVQADNAATKKTNNPLVIARIKRV